MAIDGRARPQRAANIGGEPEAIKAAGDQFEQRAAADKPRKVGLLAERRTRSRGSATSFMNSPYDLC